MKNTRPFRNTGYEYQFTCKFCGAENIAMKKEPNKEQISHRCSSCEKLDFYTRPDCRNHHGLHSNLY